LLLCAQANALIPFRKIIVAEQKIENITESSSSEDVEIEKNTKKYVSERGPFVLWENPELNPSYSPEAIDSDAVADGFEYSELADEYGEQPTRDAITNMIKAYGHGISTTSLFSQTGPTGMSLVHVWFGPNLPLFRHSHPRYGDCLYYVVAGEILLGRRRLGPGSGFFVPNGMPYKYTAGPAGVEVLEFRAGGGDENAPGMKLDEHSLASIGRLVEGSDEHRGTWQVPKNMGDTALRQAEIDAE